jgi:hypothetical protein
MHSNSSMQHSPPSASTSAPASRLQAPPSFMAETVKPAPAHRVVYIKQVLVPVTHVQSTAVYAVCRARGAEGTALPGHMGIQQQEQTRVYQGLLQQLCDQHPPVVPRPVVTTARGAMRAANFITCRTHTNQHDVSYFAGSASPASAARDQMPSTAPTCHRPLVAGRTAQACLHASSPPPW